MRQRQACVAAYLLPHASSCRIYPSLPPRLSLVPLEAATPCAALTSRVAAEAYRA
jgi:hypothetical protein